MDILDIMSFHLLPHLPRLVGCEQKTTASDTHRLHVDTHLVITIIALIQWTF